MENIKLTGKAHPPNKDIQWSSPVFSVEYESQTGERGLGNSCP